ncbi:MAG: hypothetical protein [Circular genetic element sp.]|nr:MAG: hypothetical protein [Circular genetic element sp.]
MSNPDFTLERTKTLVRQSEQLALALSLIHEQDLNAEQYSSLQAMTCTLLSRLIGDLETIITTIGVIEIQGGMGEAPMQDA